MPNQDNAPAQQCSFVQPLHEAMAAIIGLAVLIVAIWMLCNTFEAAGCAMVGANGSVDTAKVDAFNRLKDIMLYGVTLLGTVLGYYFGRVPAELRAQQAQQNAAQAQSQLTVAQDAALQSGAAVARLAAEKESLQRDTRATLERIRPGLEAAVEGPARAAPGEVADLQRVRAEIDALLARL
jgi:hypothetical protein